MSDAEILSRRVLVWWDFFHLAKMWCPTAQLTYLSKNLRKFSVSSYVRSLVSSVSLVSSLIFTKTFPLQSPGAHQLFFLSSKTFHPNTCVHILAVGDSNNSQSTHVSPWNCLNISCLKLDLSEQNLPFVMLNSIESQYILPSMPAGTDTFFNIIWHKLFLSSLHLVQFFGSSLVRGHTDSRKNAATTPWLTRSCVDNVFLLFRKIFLPLCPYIVIFPYFDLLQSIICASRAWMRRLSLIAFDSSARRIWLSAEMSTTGKGIFLPRQSYDRCVSDAVDPLDPEVVSSERPLCKGGNSFLRRVAMVAVMILLVLLIMDEHSYISMFQCLKLLMM